MIRTLSICVLLAAATAAVYWPVMRFDFVYLDDPENITQNALVTGGLTLDGLVHSMTTSHPDYWRPASWWSFMLDYELYELNAGGYHVTNLLLHVAATLLLFGAMQSMTAAPWRSALVAAVFALHPLHVESVAWVTERKDVLSAVFGFAAVWTYARFAATRSLVWYCATAGLLGLGLMAKPMLVTLPLVMLLLDLWPLRRVELPPKSAAFWRTAAHRIIEKIPLLLISAASCVMTLRGGARSVVDIPANLQWANVTVSYARYIGKMLWPTDLAVYYPFAGLFGAEPWPAVVVVFAAMLLVTMTAIAVATSRSRPFLLVGWLWFIGMLAPVIGVLQVGHQSMADRFSYIPLVGLTIILAWIAAELVERVPRTRWPVTAVLTIALFGCALLTARQVQTWRDTDALYTHALAVTKNNWKVHDFYGKYLFSEKRISEARTQYERAVAIRPDDAESRVRLANLLLHSRELFEAGEQLQHALALDPQHARAHYNLGLVQMQRGEFDASIEHLERALRLVDDGRSSDSEAEKEFRAALNLARARRTSGTDVGR